MIKKVKDWLGIEGVKIQLDIPETFSLNKNKIEGSYVISSQSEQLLQSVRIFLKERYTRGRRKSKLIDEYILGDIEIDISRVIQPGEIIEQTFTLKFSPVKSPVERFGDKNFIYRGVTGLAKLLKNAKSQYHVTVEVSVKGNKLKPYDTASIVAD